jgi:hypothetical protein
MDTPYTTMLRFEQSLYEQLVQHRETITDTSTPKVINEKNLYKINYSLAGASHMSVSIGDGKSYSTSATLFVRLNGDGVSGTVKYRIHGCKSLVDENRSLRNFVLNDISELVIVQNRLREFIKELSSNNSLQ